MYRVIVKSAAQNKIEKGFAAELLLRKARVTFTYMYCFPCIRVVSTLFFFLSFFLFFFFFLQFLVRSVLLYVETVLIEPRTSTSSFTKLMSSEFRCLATVPVCNSVEART